MSRSDSSEQDANFLGRWARRKSQARSDKQTDQQTDRAPSVPAQASEPPSQSTADEALAPIPSIESLQDDSDYSRFMEKDVGHDLRRLALRRLFKAPVFGIRDGLDDYDEDFTTFEALGTTITADMKFHKERLELEAGGQHDEPEQPLIARANPEQEGAPQPDEKQEEQTQSSGLAEDAADEKSDIATETMNPDAEEREGFIPIPGKAEMSVWDLPAQRLPESSPPVLAPRRQRLRLRIDAPEDAQESS